MKLGIIAGNRLFPIIFSQAARRGNSSIELIAICFRGETDPKIERYVDKAFWLRVGELGYLLEILKRENLKKLVMVGQVNPRRIFQKRHWDEKMRKLTKEINDFRPHTIFGKLIETMESSGVEFIDSISYMKEHLAENGVMNGLSLSNGVLRDIEFGTGLISKFVELDVGQSIVIKNKTVVALEGLEGTDRTINRAYSLAGFGCVVLKFSKQDQDLRFDVPVVGLKTLTLLKKIKAAALVLEASRVIILQKDKFLHQAYRCGIPVVGK